MLKDFWKGFVMSRETEGDELGFACGFLTLLISCYVAFCGLVFLITLVIRNVK